MVARANRCRHSGMCACGAAARGQLAGDVHQHRLPTAKQDLDARHHRDSTNKRHGAVLLKLRKFSTLPAVCGMGLAERTGTFAVYAQVQGHGP